VEREEVDREVSPPILKREKEQPDSPRWVNRELGSPPDTRSPEGLAREEGASQGYESSSEESVEEENNLVGRDMDESMEEEPFPEQEGRSQDVRNGARKNAGSNPEDVSTGEGMAATLFGTGNTKPLVGYGTQSPESVRPSVGEIEDKVSCRDTYPFERNWVRENTGSGVEGILIWTENHTPFMVDRTPSLENEKVYDRDAEVTIPLSDLHQLGKALGSSVADVRNRAHHESAAEGRDTLVDSTDLDPLDLSRDQVHMEGETVVVTRKVDPERGKSTVNGENRMLVEVVDPEPLTGDHVPFRKETGKN
jgi:hypothetical protein